MADRPHSLCRLEEIPDNAGRGFSVAAGAGEQRVEVFAVRRGARIFTYHNRCPHKGLNLDWVPDEFMDPEGRYIQCANHDALFQIEDGLCIAGPCRGAQLAAVPSIVSTDGDVIVSIAG